MNEAMHDFAYNPVTLDIPRSKIDMKHSHKTTYDTGRLIPIYWREVMPGSTVKMEMSQITRMQTPIFPIMDNAFIDTMFFYVPNRLLWSHWEEFMGENKSGFWEQQVDYTVPQIKFCYNLTKTENTGTYWKGDYYYPTGPQAGSLADYLGIPIVEANRSTPVTKGAFEVNALPFRAYYQIFNDWWRDENLMYPREFDKGDATVVADYLSADREDVWPVEKPAKVAKFHDYFTSALPQPQKHDDVLLPLGNTAPIVLGDSFRPNITNSDLKGTHLEITVPNGTGKAGNAFSVNSTLTGYNDYDATKTNGLYADLASATSSTINALRQAFAVQRYYEKLARGGKVA